MAVSAVVSWAASRSAATVLFGSDLAGEVVGTLEAGGTVLCEWTGDPPHAGHHQGALDSGGDAPKGLEVHAPRVSKAPTD